MEETTQDNTNLLFWNRDEVQARTQERHAMVNTDCEERSRCIASVEELFQVPLKKSVSSKVLTRSMMTKEQALQILTTSDYRGYELDCCCRAMMTSRRHRVIRQIILPSSYWKRGDTPHNFTKYGRPTGPALITNECMCRTSWPKRTPNVGNHPSRRCDTIKMSQ